MPTDRKMIARLFGKSLSPALSNADRRQPKLQQLAPARVQELDLYDDLFRLASLMKAWNEELS